MPSSEKEVFERVDLADIMVLNYNEKDVLDFEQASEGEDPTTQTPTASDDGWDESGLLELENELNATIDNLSASIAADIDSDNPGDACSPSADTAASGPTTCAEPTRAISTGA
jgi:hypothetical protein